MNGLVSTTAIIRQRGQLTIPDQIREMAPWLSVDSVVTVATTPSQEIIIKRHMQDTARVVNWDKVWRGIQLARSFRGKRGNLSKLIAEDRKTH